MKTQKFIKDVQKLEPRLKCLDGYFYFEPMNHFLRGFVCETTPAGAYIWVYAFPLFVRFTRLHLTFGKRLALPGGYVDFSITDKKKLPEVFVSLIQGHIETALELDSLNNFVDDIEARNILRNPNVRYVYACALVMLGRLVDAVNQLELCKQTEKAAMDQIYSNDVEQLLSAINSGRGNAKSILDDWERESKEKLRAASSK